jgi:hypothetical protein
MTEFDTYQGASTISLKTLDRKRSKISMFELDVVPQSWMPYVQMGLPENGSKSNWERETDQMYSGSERYAK